MTPSASLLLLLLLGLSQAYPLLEEEEPEEHPDEDPDAVDITTGILTANNGSNEILLEGDLVAPKTRNALNCWQNSCLWRKSSYGVVTVPYSVSREFNRREMQIILNAMQSFHSKTCIRFVPRLNENDFISIENMSGCFSSLGRMGGQQMLSISKSGCVSRGIIQHELNHALGFKHEQTRSDRDQYVWLSWENMAQSMAYNFQKSNTNNLGTPYDYSSIMHYGRTAFSINGRDTITPIPYAGVRIGQRQGLSRWDVIRINRLYNC